MATYQIESGGLYEQFSDLPALNSTDSVQFKAGEIFNPIGILSGLDGVSFGRFGVGDNPITGSLRTASFSSIGSGLWELTDSDLGSKLNVLTIDGVPRHKGRFPKSVDEYFDIASDSSDGTLNHGSLPFVATGEVVPRLQSFITNVYSVTSDSGGVITFSGYTGQYPPKAGFGFHLQNQIECLTEVGDWMYNGSTKTITIYLGANNASDYLIQYPIEEELIIIEDSTNLTFSDIDFIGSNGDAVQVDNCDNIDLTNCNIKHVGGMGVRVTNGSSNVTFNGTRVDYAFAGGLYAEFACPNISAIGCEVYDIGMISGGSDYMNYDGRSNGICFESGNENSIQNCRAERIGFNGFVFLGNGNHIAGNVAKYFCARKGDGAGFYTSIGAVPSTLTTPMLIENNMALYGIGNLYGTPDIAPNCQGFYADDNTNNGVWTNNLAAFNPKGIYIHNSKYCEFTGNTLYGNDRQLSIVQDNGMQIRTIDYRNNSHIITEIDQEMAFVYGDESEIAQFGTFEDNQYSNFNTGKPVFSTYDGSEPKPFRYDISKDKYFALLEEINPIYEDYEDLPYSVDSIINSIDYQTTVPTDFGVITGITPVQDPSGITVTKTPGPKAEAFIRIGPVTADQWYLVSGSATGDFDDLQEDFETNYVSPSSWPKNSKIESETFALPIYSPINRGTQQFSLYQEVDFTSITFRNLSFSAITVERTESVAEIVINEELGTWQVYLDGDPIPVNPGEDEYVSLSSAVTKKISVNSGITKVIQLTSKIR